MFNVGPAEVLIILIVALLVLGPKKLPDAARQMGKAMTEFRRVTSGLQDEVRIVLDDHMVEAPAPIEPTLLPPAVDATAGLPPTADAGEIPESANGDGASPPTATTPPAPPPLTPPA